MCRQRALASRQESQSRQPVAQVVTLVAPLTVAARGSTTGAFCHLGGRVGAAWEPRTGSDRFMATQIAKTGELGASSLHRRRGTVPGEKEPGVSRLDHLGGHRRLVRILRQPRVRRDDVAVPVAEQCISRKHHTIVANQGDTARGMPRHVHDPQAADRVAVPQAPVGSHRPEPQQPAICMNHSTRVDFGVWGTDGRSASGTLTDTEESAGPIEPSP